MKQIHTQPPLENLEDQGDQRQKLKPQGRMELSAAGQRWMGPKNPRWSGGNVSAPCKVCGTEFSFAPSRNNKAQFCSVKCQNEDQMVSRRKYSPFLTGIMIGYLTLIEPGPRMPRKPSGTRATWRCRCRCGNYITTSENQLRDGRTRSCGCLSRELTRARSTTHNMSRDAEYFIWKGMIRRCEDPKQRSYSSYGGAGISVCKRWHSFENFFNDMGNKPSPTHSLDRFPDRTGNYEPGNVRWATPKEQNRNTKSNRIIEINGERKCVAEWSEISGIQHFTIRGRLSRGWSVVDAVFKILDPRWRAPKRPPILTKRPK